MRFADVPDEVGSVNLMEDDEGKVWVGAHFGSRGFGHKTASGFLALAQGLPFDGRANEGEMDSPPVLFETGSELRAGLTRWIGYYNAGRPHSALAGQTPDEAYGAEEVTRLAA